MGVRSRPASGGGPRLKGKLALLLAIAIFEFLTPSAGAQEPIGYVLVLQGNWRAGGTPGRRLAKGSAVRAGETVRVEPPVDVRDFILLVGSGEHAPAVRLRCSDPGGCDHPLSLAALTPQASAHSSSILEAAVSLWIKAEPELYAVFGSRGGGAPLHESVIEIADGRADLRPALRDLAPGRYLVRLRPVHAEDREGFGVAEEVIRLEPAGAQPVWISGPPTSLCAIEVKPLDRGDSGPGETAWVLLTPEKSYRDASQRFGELVALTQGWSNEVDPEATRELLRAALDYLATAGLGGKAHD